VPSRTGLIHQLSGVNEVSRFSCVLFPGMPGFFDYGGLGRGPRCFAPADIAFPIVEQGRRPRLGFRSSYSRLPVPLSTLRLWPHDQLRKTQGQDGSRLLSC